MDSATSVLTLFKAAGAVTDRRMNAALEEIGVTHCQASVILGIGREGTKSMSCLSDMLCCHKSNITQIVDMLSKKKIIMRIPCKEDRRVYELKLTPKGRALFARVETALNRESERCLAIFSAPECKLVKQMLEKYVGKQVTVA